MENCEGCYICCHIYERHKYLTIENIQISGFSKENDIFNGVYKLTCDTSHGKSSYEKYELNRTTRLFYVAKYWILAEIHNKYNVGIRFHHKIKCPVAIWDTKYNSSTFHDLENPICITIPTDTCDIKPAKK